MSNEIRSIASVKGLFGRKWVHLHNECDLMKPVGKDMFGGTCYTIEEFEVKRYVMGRYAIGLCVNSYPFFCRYDLCEYSDGTQRQTWLEDLTTDNSVHGQMKDVANYDRVCPKCGWGVSAYLAIRCKYDDEFGVCHYDSNGKVTKPQTTFEAYLQLCRKVYYLTPDAKGKTQYDRWQYYKANDNVEAINRLEAVFLQEHLAAEKQYRLRSKTIIDNNGNDISANTKFFAGQLDSVVAAYLDFVQGKIEAGAREKKQEADKWVIDPDVTLRVFGGDRAKAVDYLERVIDNGYGPSRYGQATGKILKIKKQRGYGKLIWLLICANDKTQDPKSVKTFNKEW